MNEAPPVPGAGGVSLVIPAYNAAKTLPACLDAVTPLLGRDDLREILLVDDGSRDETAAIAGRYPVRVLPGPRQGPGAARNVGWRAAANALVWFIDSDCVVQPDALRVLLELLDEERVGGAGGSYGNQCPDSLLACLIHEEIVERHRAMATEVNYLATFNVVYRRTALEAVGGFNEALRTAEDADLAFRIHEAGYRLRFTTRSLVGHFHPTQLLPYLRTQARHGYYRVLLYLSHRGKAAGDSYSNLVDHVQPPLAMLTLATLPLAVWPPLALIPAALALVLLATQLPLTLRLIRRTRQFKYAWFVPFGFVRSFWRGVGMTRAVFRALFFPLGLATEETR